MINQYIQTTFDNLITLSQTSKFTSMCSVELSMPRQCGKTATIAQIAVDYNRAIVVTRYRDNRLNLKRLMLDIESSAKVEPKHPVLKLLSKSKPQPKTFSKGSIYHISRLSQIGNDYRGLILTGYVILLDELTISEFMRTMNEYPTNSWMNDAIRNGSLPILSVK